MFLLYESYEQQVSQIPILDIIHFHVASSCAGSLGRCQQNIVLHLEIDGTVSINLPGIDVRIKFAS